MHDSSAEGWTKMGPKNGGGRVANDSCHTGIFASARVNAAHHSRSFLGTPAPAGGW
jgi:hypothetical protein